jgi:hypothetical protein
MYYNLFDDQFRKKIKTTECKGTSAEKNGHHNIFVDKYGMKGVIHLTVFES